MLLHAHSPPLPHRLFAPPLYPLQVRCFSSRLDLLVAPVVPSPFPPPRLRLAPFRPPRFSGPCPAPLSPDPDFPPLRPPTCPTLPCPAYPAAAGPPCEPALCRDPGRLCCCHRLPVWPLSSALVPGRVVVVCFGVSLGSACLLCVRSIAVFCCGGGGTPLCFCFLVPLAGGCCCVVIEGVRRWGSCMHPAALSLVAQPPALRAFVHWGWSHQAPAISLSPRCARLTSLCVAVSLAPLHS